MLYQFSRENLTSDMSCCATSIWELNTETKRFCEIWRLMRLTSFSLGDEVRHCWLFLVVFLFFVKKYFFWKT